MQPLLSLLDIKAAILHIFSVTGVDAVRFVSNCAVTIEISCFYVANPYNYRLWDPRVGSALLNWFQTAKDKKEQKASPNIFVVLKYPGYRFFCNPPSRFSC
jgi:hypothetical protein